MDHSDGEMSLRILKIFKHSILTIDLLSIVIIIIENCLIDYSPDQECPLLSNTWYDFYDYHIYSVFLTIAKRNHFHALSLSHSFLLRLINSIYSRLHVIYIPWHLHGTRDCIFDQYMCDSPLNN